VRGSGLGVPCCHDKWTALGPPLPSLNIGSWQGPWATVSGCGENKL